MKKSTLIMMIIALSVGIGLKVTKFSQVSISEIPSFLNSMRAKEFCSCYFLLEKPKNYCLDLIGKGYPISESNIKIDRDSNQVEFTLYGIGLRKAKVISKRLGCRIY